MHASSRVSHQVMRSLWEIDGGNSARRLKKWHEILMDNAERDRRRRERADRDRADKARMWVHDAPDMTFK